MKNEKSVTVEEKKIVTRYCRQYPNCGNCEHKPKEESVDAPGSIEEKLRESFVELKNDVIAHELEKKGFCKPDNWILGLIQICERNILVVVGAECVGKQQLKKLIEDTKVDVLGMFCYQGPPTKHWIDTKGQFWFGWNKACDKVLELLTK